MKDLKYREDKIRAKRKQTSFRDFLKEIGSYYNLNLYKNPIGETTCICPKSSCKGVSYLDFENIREGYMDFGLDYSGDFWLDYRKVFDQISYPNLAKWGDVYNADFAHKVFYSNECYLSFEICYSEKVAYSVNVKDNCSYIFNSMMIGDNSENIYNSVGIYQSSNIFYSRFIFDSSFIRFSSNLIGCTECLFCNDLQYQKYCIRNQQYTKEEYLKLKEDVLSDKIKFQQYFVDLKVNNTLSACDNTQGSYVMKSDNLENAMFCYNIHNGRNTLFVGDNKGCENFYDVGSAAYGKDYCGLVGGGLGSHAYCSIEIVGGSNIYYSYFLNECSYCIGCIGLKNKQYCILNKQYTKEEWYKKANEIFTELKDKNLLGSFFLGWMNPFYFNDTAACLIDDSFTKQEVESEGYLWRDEEIKVDIPEGVEVISTNDLDQYEGFDDSGVWNINPEVMKKVICDEKGNYYKIVKMEYDFLVKYGLPLPRLHWLDRIETNFKLERS